jgi:sortase (surface protein transpeptidase)
MPFPRRLALDAVTALLALGGLILVVIGGSPPPQRPRAADASPSDSAAFTSVGPPAPSTRPPSTRPPPAQLPSTQPPGPPALRPATPVRLEIPAIGVNTTLMTVGLNPDGTMVVPPTRSDAPAGWYRYLPTPGEVGPAVIVGHVDTARDGPAVFFRLRELRAGDRITVRREDGTAVTFTVSSVTQYQKDAFPSESVYGPVDHPALRLITCGGSFDQVRRTYRGNIVVYAHVAAQPSTGTPKA